MYLTSHRVQSQAGDEGINAWMHVHGKVTWPTSLRQILDLVETTPGQLVDHSYGLKPGGNSVLAYLDVIAPNDTPRDLIIAAIDHLYRVDPQEAPIAILAGPIAVRMSACSGRRKLWAQDVEDLSRAVENLLRRDLRLRAGRPPSAKTSSISR